MKKIKLIMMLLGYLTIVTSLSAQKVGDVAPDFEFPSIDGTTIKLTDYEDKVLVIFVFGNACPFCISAGDDIESKIYKAYKDSTGFAMIGLDTWNSSSSVTSVSNFRDNAKVSFKLGYSAGDFANLYSTTYDRLIVIDKSGKIAFKGTSGAQNDVEKVADKVPDLLAAEIPTAIENYYETSNSPYFTISLFPNPIKDYGRFKILTNQDCNCNISIFNAVGVKYFDTGSQNLAVGEHAIDFDASILSKGIYFYQVEIGNETITRRFVVK